MSITINVSGFIVSDIISEKRVQVVLRPPDLIFLEKESGEIDREVNVITEVEYDKITYNSRPLIIIGDKKYT